jgi:hypothetical protein
VIRLFPQLLEVKMGKRVLMFMLMFGVAGALWAVPWANQDMGPVLVSSPSINTWWGLDSPQPDTILYDDPTVGSYRLYGGTFYCSVRFTPLLDYTLRAAYIGVSVVNMDTLTTVWVAGDAAGFADPNNILSTATFTPVNGWNQIDFTDSLSFLADEDFHIVYGPLVATNNPDPGPGTYPLLDSNADWLNRSYYNSTWPASGPSSPVYGYDWRVRAGGEYGGGGWVDLGVVNVDNDVMKFFLCQDDVVTFQAWIENVGTLDVDTFNVEWVVRDEASVVVFTTTGTYVGPLAVGGDTSVVAPASWTAGTLGEFIVTATVTATGDAIPENDSKMLEQQVDDPSLAQLLDYDIPNFQVNLSLSALNGRAMEFTPCVYPVIITEMQMEITSAAGTARLAIYGDDGSDAPDPTNVLFDTTAALATGNNIFPVDSIPIASGSFYLAYIATDANSPTIPMDAAPSAGENLTMGVMYETSDNGAIWAWDLGGDHPLRARIMPYGAAIRDIRMDWLTFAGFFVPENTSIAHEVQVTNNGTQADTFDVTLTIEDTTFTESVVYTETQTVYNLAVGDSATVTFGTYNYASPGEYIVTAEAVVPGDATPGNNTIMAETQVCVYPSELTYDDGDFENGWAYYDPGNFWGARFDPPIYPCIITDVRLNFSTVPAGYDDAKAQIIDDDGTTILYNYLDESVVEGWNTYAIPDILVMNSFFYAGTEWVTGAPNAPYFATDTSDPISFMARQRIAGVWYYDVEDAGVRVTVDAAVIDNVEIGYVPVADDDIVLTWDFDGISGETYYFIYEADEPYGTFALVDSVLHPTQTWTDVGVTEEKKFYYVTLGDASGSRANTLPGQYLWFPVEITVSGAEVVEPGVTRAPRQAAQQVR